MPYIGKVKFVKINLSWRGGGGEWKEKNQVDVRIWVNIKDRW